MLKNWDEFLDRLDIPAGPIMKGKPYKSGLLPYLLENNPHFANWTDEQKEEYLRQAKDSFDATMESLNRG